MAEMDAEIAGGVRFGVGRYLREPGAGHHDGRGAHEALFEGLDGGLVGGVAHSRIVSVDD